MKRITGTLKTFFLTTAVFFSFCSLSFAQVGNENPVDGVKDVIDRTQELTTSNFYSLVDYQTKVLRVYSSATLIDIPSEIATFNGLRLASAPVYLRAFGLPCKRITSNVPGFELFIPMGTVSQYQSFVTYFGGLSSAAVGVGACTASNYCEAGTDTLKRPLSTDVNCAASGQVCMNGACTTCDNLCSGYPAEPTPPKPAAHATYVTTSCNNKGVGSCTASTANVGWTCNAADGYTKTADSLGCEPICTPDCTGKECGSDGCTGTCGTCAASEPVCMAGTCYPDTCVWSDSTSTQGCTVSFGGCDVAGVATCNGMGGLGPCVATATDPRLDNCLNRECGSDGCGGTCGPDCAGTLMCDVNGKCVSSVCSTNAECSDGNACTDDFCNNPGASNAFCTHPNNAAVVSCTKQFGTLCLVTGSATCSGGAPGNCDAVDPTTWSPDPATQCSGPFTQNGSCGQTQGATGTKVCTCTSNGCEAITCSTTTCDNGCIANATGTKAKDCSAASAYCSNVTFNDANGCGTNNCTGTKIGTCSGASTVCVGDTFNDSCGNATCIGTKAGTCSGANTVCSGIPFNDSCGDATCTGTKTDGVCATCTPSGTEICGNTVDEDCSGSYLTCSGGTPVCSAGACRAPQCTGVPSDSTQCQGVLGSTVDVSSTLLAGCPSGPSACSYICTAPKVRSGTSCVDPAKCTLPASLGGGEIASGTSVDAYSTSSVACDGTCPAKQVRICTNGTLSGTYTNSSCSKTTCSGTTSRCNTTSHTCVECLDNSHCDDGLSCTTNTCSSGACTYPVNSGYTVIGGVCKADCAAGSYTDGGYTGCPAGVHAATATLTKSNDIGGAIRVCNRVIGCNNGTWEYNSESCVDTPVACYNPAGCTDNNDCTTDVCENAGTVNALCTYSNNIGAACGGTTCASNILYTNGSCVYDSDQDRIECGNWSQTNCAYGCSGSACRECLVDSNCDADLSCVGKVRHYEKCVGGVCQAATETCADICLPGGCTTTPEICYTWQCHLSKWTKGSAGCATPGNCPENAENRVHVQESVCISGSPGAPCEDSCFIAGTKILMADGTHKLIEKVRKGDMLQGMDSTNVVLNTMIRQYDGWLYSINGGKYFVTDSHPFMTKGGIWKAFDPEAAKRENPQLDIQELKVGDILITRKAPVEVIKVDRKKKKTKVYNFVVDNAHHYYADGYLVHNKIMCDNVTYFCAANYECITGECR